VRARARLARGSLRSVTLRSDRIVITELINPAKILTALPRFSGELYLSFIVKVPQLSGIG
jgi:hypothetical protein